MSNSKDYINEDIKIIWKKDLCIHSANCVRNLPGVFKPHERPWITIENADTEHLIETVNKCPSGALTWTKLGNEEDEDGGNENKPIQIEVCEDGPLLLKGNCSIKHANGNITSKSGQIALCRCGFSEKKPYCDGSHKKEGFRAE